MNENGNKPLSLIDVDVRRGGKQIFKNLTLHLDQGKTLSLIGPSGAGKSTIVELILGSLRPDRGKIHLFDRPLDYDYIERERRRMGYAVQGTGLYPHMTVKANIILMAKLEKWDRNKIEERLNHLVRLVNLTADHLKRYPHQLSGGERQRAGLCRAMMLDPEILLLDEPFGALDPITRSAIQKELLDIQASESRTILLVTHDMSEAVKMGDRVALLYRGKIEQTGTPEELRENPSSDIVKKFLLENIES